MLPTLYEGDYSNHDANVSQSEPGGVVARLRAFQRSMIMRAEPLSALRGGSGRLLDVGCGNGVFTAMAEDLGWTVTGIEPDPQVCEVAGETIDDVRVGNVKTAELKGDQFDAVLFNHTLEHVADPVADLRAAYELVRPGGMLLIAVPHYGTWQRRWLGKNWLMLELPRHRTHFTAMGLKTVVRRAGFVVDKQGFGSAMGMIPTSLVIAATGDTRAANGRLMSLFLSAVSVLIAAPVAIYNKLTGDGEALTLVAHRPVP